MTYGSLKITHFDWLHGSKHGLVPKLGHVCAESFCPSRKIIIIANPNKFIAYLQKHNCFHNALMKMRRCPKYLEFFDSIYLGESMAFNAIFVSALIGRCDFTLSNWRAVQVTWYQRTN